MQPEQSSVNRDFDRLVERQYREDRDAIEVIAAAVERQRQAFPDCENCGGVGWHTPITIEVYGIEMFAGGDCPRCHGTGKTRS